MENWKDINGYDGKYRVSDQGRVMSLVGGRPKILKPNIDTKGYRYINLSKDKKSKSKNIHRLVAKAFLGESILHVDHIDRNRLNNNLSNLRYLTPKENNAHSQLSRSLGVRKINPEILKEIKELRSKGLRVVEIAKIYNFHRTSVYNAIKNY